MSSGSHEGDRNLREAPVLWRMVGSSAMAVAIVILIGQAACTARAALQRPPTDAPTRTVELTAEKYSFTPSEIRVKRGTVLRLVCESLDTEHGIAIARYGIDKDIPKRGGGAVTVELYASEAGTFPIRCSNFCGVGHPWMSGKLIVED